MKRRGWENSNKKSRDRVFSLIFNAVFLYVFFVFFSASIYLYHHGIGIFGTGLSGHLESFLVGVLSFFGMIKQAFNIYFA